jgi:hypothetical protein
VIVRWSQTCCSSASNDRSTAREARESIEFRLETRFNIFTANLWVDCQIKRTQGMRQVHTAGDPQEDHPRQDP